jgi:hypothetical protein
MPTEVQSMPRPTRSATRLFNALFEGLWNIAILAPFALFGMAAIVVPGWWKALACAAVPGWLVLLIYAASRADEKVDAFFDELDRDGRDHL